MALLVAIRSLMVVSSIYINFLLVFSAGGRYNTDTGLPVVVGGSLHLALVGGDAEGFFFYGAHTLTSKVCPYRINAIYTIIRSFSIGNMNE